MPKNRPSFSFTALFSFLYLFMVLALWAMPHWPPSLWWLGNLISIGPLWTFLVPLLFLFLLCFPYRSVWPIVANVISAVIVVFGVMGYEPPKPPARAQEDDFAFTVMSVNVGPKTDMAALLQAIRTLSIDVVTLQELDSQEEEYLRMNLGGDWTVANAKHLGIASRFEIASSNFADRRRFGRWGGIVARYDAVTPGGIVPVHNVHLATPRDGLQGLRYNPLGVVGIMQHITQRQEEESALAVRFIGSAAPVVIGGDFNMPVNNPLFHKYWGKYRNAFSTGGQGLGYTKYTRYHGVRIDHILTDRNWRVLWADVGPEVGSDHRPVLARIAKDDGGKKGKADVKTREESRGPMGNDALRSRLASGMGIKTWPLSPYSTLQMTYRIPTHVPMSLIVQTTFGDWICIAGTPAAVCPNATVKPYNAATLVADGHWQEVAIDVRRIVHSVLPNVTTLKGIQVDSPAVKEIGIADLEITGRMRE